MSIHCLNHIRKIFLYYKPSLLTTNHSPPVFPLFQQTSQQWKKNHWSFNPGKMTTPLYIGYF